MSRSSHSLPLAQRFQIHELPGWWAKYLEVPPGKIGVAIDAQGEARVWTTSGRYRVLGPAARLRGKGVGLKTGWVPGEAFVFQIQIPYLMSGDDKLIIWRAAIQGRVQDPVLFFQQHVLPRGVLHHLSLTLSTPEARSAISSITQQYAAEDLARIHTISPIELRDHLRYSVNTFLAEEGLVADDIVTMLFWEVEKQADLEEKLLEWRERWRQLEIEAEMVETETQTRWAEFQKEIEADLGVQIATPTRVTASEESKVPKWRAGIRALLQKNETRHPFLQGLWKKDRSMASKTALPVPRVSRWWWVPGTLVIFLLWFVAIAIAIGISRMRGEGAWWEYWEIWVPAVGLTLERIKALYEKRERLAEASWVLRGYTRVDDLVRQNRVRADHLVRQQSAAMLQSMAQMLRQLRSRVFHQNNTELALRLRSLQRETERLAEDVMRPDFGRPPYVDATLNISKIVWDSMLDYDEDLLVHLHHMLEKVRRLSEQWYTAHPIDDTLQQIEQQLADFRLQFTRRSEALRPRTDTPA